MAADTPAPCKFIFLSGIWNSDCACGVEDHVWNDTNAMAANYFEKESDQGSHFDPGPRRLVSCQTKSGCVEVTNWAQRLWSFRLRSFNVSMSVCWDGVSAEWVWRQSPNIGLSWPEFYITASSQTVLYRVQSILFTFFFFLNRLIVISRVKRFQELWICSHCFAFRWSSSCEKLRHCRSFVQLWGFTCNSLIHEWQGSIINLWTVSEQLYVI